MTWLGIFRKRSLSADKLQKIAKLASDPFAQSDVRMSEMQRLLDEDHVDALHAVLKRFRTTAEGTIADEDEKAWLAGQLEKIGEKAVVPIEEYIRKEEKLTHVLRVYERIKGQEQALSFFTEVLAAYGPEDHRSIDAKLQIVVHLSEYELSPEILQKLVAFLHDHSDDVQWMVMDIFDRSEQLDNAAQASLLAQVAIQLGALLQQKDTPLRIQQRAAELLARKNWVLPASLQTDLPEPISQRYFIDKKGFVRARIPANAV